MSTKDDVSPKYEKIVRAACHAAFTQEISADEWEEVVSESATLEEVKARHLKVIQF
jgi:hypothetical protein